MKRAPAPTGVCIVRVEPRDRGVRLTVLLNPDIGRRTIETSREFTQVADALAEIERFLRTCAERTKR